MFQGKGQQAKAELKTCLEELLVFLCALIFSVHTLESEQQERKLQLSGYLRQNTFISNIKKKWFQTYMSIYKAD